MSSCRRCAAGDYGRERREDGLRHGATSPAPGTAPPSLYSPHPDNRVPVAVGDRVRVEALFSEVCMHMRVAGTVMVVEVLGGTYTDGRPWYIAQLYRLDGRPFSAPITLGEAGIFGWGDDMYTYGVKVAKP